MFGLNKKNEVGLLVKDVLVDLESNPSRVDEMIEKMVKGESSMQDLSAMGFVSASSMTARWPSEMDVAMKSMAQAAVSQQYTIYSKRDMQNEARNEMLRNAFGNIGGGLSGSR